MQICGLQFIKSNLPGYPSLILVPFLITHLFPSPIYCEMRKFCISCVGCLPHCCSARTASQIFRWREGSNVAFVATFMAFKLPKSAKQRICLGWIKLAYTRLHKKRNMSHIQFTLIESTACRIFITLWKLFKSLIIYCPEICPFLIAQI